MSDVLREIENADVLLCYHGRGTRVPAECVSSMAARNSNVTWRHSGGWAVEICGRRSDGTASRILHPLSGRR